MIVHCGTPLPELRYPCPLVTLLACGVCCCFAESSAPSFPALKAVDVLAASLTVGQRAVPHHGHGAHGVGAGRRHRRTLSPTSAQRSSPGDSSGSDSSDSDARHTASPFAAHSRTRGHSRHGTRELVVEGSSSSSSDDDDVDGDVGPGARRISVVGRLPAMLRVAPSSPSRSPEASPAHRLWGMRSVASRTHSSWLEPNSPQATGKRENSLATVSRRIEQLDSSLRDIKDMLTPTRPTPAVVEPATNHVSHWFFK